MNEEVVKVYEGFFAGKLYAFALSYDKARAIVLNCYAYGDPDEYEYAVGDTWSSLDREGWSIEERRVAVGLVDGKAMDLEFKTSGHVSWECPRCEKEYSEDWDLSDGSEFLSKCACSDQYIKILVLL